MNYIAIDGDTEVHVTAKNKMVKPCSLHQLPRFPICHCKLTKQNMEIQEHFPTDCNALIQTKNIKYLSAYLVPTEHLPFLKPSQSLGFIKKIRWDTVLKPILNNIIRDRGTVQ